MKQPRTIFLITALVAVVAGMVWFARDARDHSAHSNSHAAATRFEPSASRRSITDTGVEWPSAERIQRTLLMADYNTRVIFAGVTVLGATGGLVGTFLLLRKRSLLSDTVSHCTLPGIALAFLLAEARGMSGRSLPVLLAGAVAAGVLGMLSVALIRAKSKVKDDAALAIVLSVFFGFGVALLVLVQQLPTGNAAGLKSYIYGKAAAMIAADAKLILFASLAVAAVCGSLFKEFKILCFDSGYAQTQGWPVVILDLALMALVVAVTVIGLQAVGLLLVVALLIIPPAAARFWSHRLGTTVMLATLVGAVSGFVGVATSALFSKLPAGAVIVLAAVFCFAISFVFGARRGLLVLWWERRRTEQRVSRLHLLRAIYEWCEQTTASHGERSESIAMLDRVVPLEDLRQANSWSPTRLRLLLRLGERQDLVTTDAQSGTCHLTGHGKLEARRATRNHRLWETYLLQHADVAPQHIHHNADQIEHVIDPYIVNELEELLVSRGGTMVPADPERPAVVENPPR